MNASILVIEADERFRRDLADYLKSQSYGIEEAEDETDAELQLGQQRFDVVLLGMSGLKQGLPLLERIRSVMPKAKVILMLQAGQVKLSIEGMKRGAFDDIQIPLDKDSLLEKLRKACEVRRV